MAYNKGDRAERFLVKKIENNLGYYAQRTPSSGAATDANRPDVIGMRNTDDGSCHSVFFEAKQRTHPTVRFSKREVEDLEEAANRAGAVPVLAVRPNMKKYDQWHCFYPDELKINKKSLSIVDKHVPGRTVSDVMDEGP